MSFDPISIGVTIGGVLAGIGGGYSAAIRMLPKIATKKQQAHNCRFSSDLEEKVDRNNQKTSELRGEIALIKEQFLPAIQNIIRVEERTRWLEPKAPMAAVVESKSTDKKYVLIAEDRNHLAEGLATFLQLNDFYVSKAITVSEAKELLAAQKFNFAVIDIELTPGERDGIALGSFIHKEYPETQLIFWTGRDVNTEDFLFPPNSRLAIKGSWEDVLTQIRESEK